MIVLSSRQNVSADSAQFRHNAVVTEYCDYGTTASGYLTHIGEAAGAYWLPMGSIVSIAGVGQFIIEDRGQPIFDVDIYTPRCIDALYFGRQYVTIYVLRWGW